MAIKSSGGNPPTNSLSFSEIENEFGQNSERSLGDYRMNNLNIGGLTEVSLSRDGCGINANGDIPVDNQEIKFSDFYNARQNIYLDFYSSNQTRKNAKNDKYNASNANGNYLVVGSPTNAKPTSTSGKKVIIHVTKIIGSARGNANLVALRTGNWNSGTEVLVEVTENGKIIGAGGKGGNGRESSSGLPGENGTSALGIDYNNTKIQTSEGGSIVCGFGGGGAGGGGETKKEGGFWGGGRGPEVKAGGGGGGGGQGFPGGPGGTCPEDGGNGTAGDHEAAGNGGNPGSICSSGVACINGGTGGEGGHLGDNSADKGQKGFLSGSKHEDPSTNDGGNGGTNGAAIRKANNNINFILVGGSINSTGATNATGIS